MLLTPASHGNLLWLIDSVCSPRRMMWAAGAVAAMSSITFPAISAIVSRNADPDQQGEPVGVKVLKVERLCRLF